MWLKRELSSIWPTHHGQPVRVLVGPRQGGKASFLEHHSEPERRILSFDDLATREFAQRDPRTFLDQLPTKLILDEVQYAPPEPILFSPAIGFLFENLVASEIIKSRDCLLKDWQLFHWRTKDREEIDFIITSPNKTLAMECKYSGVEASRFKPSREILNIPKVDFAVVSMRGGSSAHGIRHLSIYELKDFLLTYFV